MRDESFGPVVAVAPVENDAAAVHAINNSNFGLTASLWTRDPQRAAAMARNIDCGTIFMNRRFVLS